MDGLLLLIIVFLGVGVLAALKSGIFTAISGKVGAWRVHHVLHSSLSPAFYILLRDVTLPAPTGRTHIDDLVVSPYGIFVITVCRQSGLISGDEQQSEWTRTRRRSTQTFLSPLLQNRLNIRVLQTLLGLDESCFHSIVIFSGRARFSQKMPANVTQAGGLVPYIQVRNQKVIEHDDIRALAQKVEFSRLASTGAANAAHVASLKAARFPAGIFGNRRLKSAD